MTDESSRGPEVPAHEDLLRGIRHSRWWNSDEDRPSSAVFSHPKVSAFLASLKSEETLLAALPDGSGILRFNAGQAKDLMFDSHLEPELGDEAHVHVYRPKSSSKRKKMFQKLLMASKTQIIKPDYDRLVAFEASG